MAEIYTYDRTLQNLRRSYFYQLIRIKYHDQLLKIMDFVSQVRKNLEGKLRIEDGNCGTTHKVLKEISPPGGRAITWEQADGVRSSILDKGNVVGRGEGITWPPAILFALVEGGFFPKQIESELTKSLQCILDMEKVDYIYGYGRVCCEIFENEKVLGRYARSNCAVKERAQENK